MAQAEGRTTYPPVVVSPSRVQESGLLKDDIRLDFPDEAGQFDTVLLRRATRVAQEATKLWRDYARREGANAVVPLLVVQVPNKPTDALLVRAFNTIRDAWPTLEPDAIAHVFGDHAPIRLAGVTVPHVAPETVQDQTHMRVLLAKDAISTGWDCPRAEVLVSFRPAKDETHITQLLGRMVRTPLPRRVPGNDLLNSVSCVLPHFDRPTARKVATNMLVDRAQDEDGTGGGDGRRVLFKAVDMTINPGVPLAVWQAFDALPSETLPRNSVRPTRKLSALVHELAHDRLKANARKDAYRRLCQKLDGLLAQHQEEVAKASKGILRVEGATVVSRVVGGTVRSQESFVEAADERSVEADFQAAGRALTADLARAYADHLAGGDSADDGLFDSHVTVAALSQIPGVSDELDQEADRLCTELFDDCRVAIKDLPDERQAVYDEIRGMSRDVQTSDLKRPRVRAEETEDENGQKLEMRPGHLMSDPDGMFPIQSLNSWEIHVLDEELRRNGFQAWYRNSARASGDALAVAYQDAPACWRRMFPDFLFFHRSGGDVRASIIDPHGHHLVDALPKLRGLARFAEAHGRHFHRIESVARVANGTLRVLDLTDPKVREAVAAQNTIAGRDAVEDLYLGELAHTY